jgi:hypothetical protein
MTTELTVDVDGAALVAEMQRYLAAVDTFRAEGREPRWLDQGTPFHVPEPPQERTPCRHRRSS